MPLWFRLGRFVALLLTGITLLSGCSGRSVPPSTQPSPAIHCDPAQDTCDGADPHASGCWIADGLILTSTTWNNHLSDETPMETDLMWSKACQSWWVHTYATSLHAAIVPISATITFCPRHGACRASGATASALDVWTPMLTRTTGGTVQACGAPASQDLIRGSCVKMPA